MKYLTAIQDRICNLPAEDAIIWQNCRYSYAWLDQAVSHWTRKLAWLPSGSVILVEGDFSPTAVAILLTLIELEMIVAPVTRTATARTREVEEIGDVEISIRIADDESVAITSTGRRACHSHYVTLRERRHPGLVVFSSGSTGKSKAVVHDLVPLLENFNGRGRRLRAISFLLFDHIGGINTMLQMLSNGGCLIVPLERSADGVLEAVEQHRAELLPVSPTFLNLVLLSAAYERHDLSSLRIVSYGTEVMPEVTLARFHKLFPDMDLVQLYGMSELGILRSRSRTPDSVWVKLAGDGVQTRVTDGRLQVKAASTMLGYLNEESSITADGWLETGDLVAQDGEYLKFLGRATDIINVGGEKVHPAEVESVIIDVDNVVEAVVYGEPHAIVGNIVCATVRLAAPESRRDIVSRIQRRCSERLQPYKVPVKVRLSDAPLHNARFKKFSGRHVRPEPDGIEVEGGQTRSQPSFNSGLPSGEAFSATGQRADDTNTSF